MDDFQLADLTRFIIEAKRSTFASDSGNAPSSYLGSNDLTFTNGAWSYHDSFFGNRDFIGREIVFYADEPIWGMAYFGRVLKSPVALKKLWSLLKIALLKTYSEDRFLGPSIYTEANLRYEDNNVGDTRCFSGKEIIFLLNEPIYQLDYFGGLIQ